MGGLYLTIEAVSFLACLVIYLPVAAFVSWKLMPRLSPLGKVLSLTLLAAHIIVFFFGLALPPASGFEAWLWDFTAEFNIPGVLASAQLTLIAALALANAWARRRDGWWGCCYFLSIGGIFLLLSTAEYSDQIKTIAASLFHWQVYAVFFGSAVAWLTLMDMQRQPRHRWAWHGTLLVGLLLTAVGGLLLDKWGPRCISILVSPADGCVKFGYYEEVVEYLGGWLIALALLGRLTAVSAALGRAAKALMLAFPVFWTALLIALVPLPPVTQWTAHRPVKAQFESGVELHGFSLAMRDSTVHYTLLMSPHAWDFAGGGYSIQLIDLETGQTVYAKDEDLTTRRAMRMAPGYVPVFSQAGTLDIPPDAPPNRAVKAVLTQWQRADGGFPLQRILNSDLPTLGEKKLVLEEFVLRPRPSRAQPLATFDKGFALLSAALPARAQPGETLPLTFAWGSDVDYKKELVQFLHFVHADSGAWWGFDQQPLGARLPTRLWYSGLVDSETWQVPLPADLAPGRYEVFTGLYRLRDERRLAVSDAAGNAYVDGRIPLGGLTLTRN